MMNVNTSWNFENDETQWIEIVKKSYPNLNISSLRQDFSYPMNQKWNDSTLLKNRISSHELPKLILKNVSIPQKELKKFNISKTIKESDLKKYDCNVYCHHVQGMDARWEIVFALFDFVQKWRTKKLKKEIKILNVINHDLFFQQIKHLSFEVVINRLCQILGIKLKIGMDIIVSEKMYCSTDPKNNLIRLSYALQGALTLRPENIIQLPLPGFNAADAWKFAVQTYNVLHFESDLLKDLNPFIGATFFEQAVKDYSEKIWDGLLYLNKLPNTKEVDIFYKQIIEKFHVEKNDQYLEKKIKVVGVNDFISPCVEKVKKHYKSDIDPIEKLKLELEKKLKPQFRGFRFCFLGDKSKLSYRLNEIYQLFAILDINVTWEQFNNGISKAIVVTDLPDFTLESNLKDMKVICFYSMHVELKIKNKKVVVSLNQNPFKFWLEFRDAIK